MTRAVHLNWLVAEIRKTQINLTNSFRGLSTTNGDSDEWFKRKWSLQLNLRLSLSQLSEWEPRSCQLLNQLSCFVCGQVSCPYRQDHDARRVDRSWQSNCPPNPERHGPCWLGRWVRHTRPCYSWRQLLLLQAELQVPRLRRAFTESRPPLPEHAVSQQRSAAWFCAAWTEP